MQHFFVIHIFLRVCECVSTRSCEWHMPLLRYAHVFFYFSKRKTNQYQRRDFKRDAIHFILFVLISLFVTRFFSSSFLHHSRIMPYTHIIYTHRYDDLMGCAMLLNKLRNTYRARCVYAFQILHAMEANRMMEACNLRVKLGQQTGNVCAREQHMRFSIYDAYDFNIVCMLYINFQLNNLKLFIHTQLWF